LNVLKAKYNQRHVNCKHALQSLAANSISHSWNSIRQCSFKFTV